MHDDETAVSYPRWAWGLVWVGFPLIGAAAVWLLLVVIRWVTPLPSVPFSKPLNLIGAIGDPQGSIVAAVIGAAVGLFVAVKSAADVLEVHVANDVVRLSRGGKGERVYGREQVAGVFHDAGQLVLLGADSGELAREKHDLAEADVRKAFETRGWPWLTADPHAGKYRRFVDDDPDLPPAANAMLKARAVALSKGDHHDLSELRDEVAKLGVVVRDENKRQYWRLVR